MNTTTPSARHILIPCDFSEGSRQSLLAAVALARQTGARLTLLYVLPVTLPPDISHLGATLNTGKLLQTAREQLTALARANVPAEIPAEILVAEGGPYHEINATARQLNADLILIATHGHSGLKHLLLGSTAERVVRHAPCPVLTWRLGADASPPTPKFQNLLVPVDFSPATDQALRHAMHYVREFAGKITLLHVVEPPPYPEWGYAHLVRRDTALKTIARKKLDTLTTDLERQGCTVNAIRIVTGDADTQICHTAEQLHPDLLIIPTHGHSALTQMFLGGTAERVVRHAACPVLVVRAKAPVITRSKKTSAPKKS